MLILNLHQNNQERKKIAHVMYKSRIMSCSCHPRKHFLPWNYFPEPRLSLPLFLTLRSAKPLIKNEKNMSQVKPVETGMVHRVILIYW